MDLNMIECETAERDVDEQAMCVCKGGPTLDILQEVHRIYEERLEKIECLGGPLMLKRQVGVLQAWVSDLLAQNALLTRAVQSLEQDATAGVLLERRRHRESGQKKKVCEKVTELKILNDTLQKENVNKDREIRRLNKDMQQYEQTIINLRNEMCSHYSGDIPKKDAQVMAGMCCVGRERGDEGELEPVKDCGAPAAYSARLPDSQGALKNGSGASVRALRADNAALGEELASARRVCVALKAQWRAAELSSRFKDEIIREMRRQLSQAKAKLKNSANSLKTSSMGSQNMDRESSSPPGRAPRAAPPRAPARPARALSTPECRTLEIRIPLSDDALSNQT